MIRIGRLAGGTRRTRRALRAGLVSLLLGGGVALAGPVTPVGAAAPASEDTSAAVTYQLNASHDGFYDDPGFVAPFPKAWSKTLVGTVGYPLIAEGRVFVAVANPASRNVIVEALSLATGEVLWGPTPVGGSTAGWIAYDDGRVFAINNEGDLSAIDAVTGTLDWTVDLPYKYSFSSPPTTVDGVVYVVGSGTGGTLYAVDAETGHIVWANHHAGSGDHSSPAVDGEGVYVSFSCHQAYRFDFAGAQVWHHSGPCVGGGGRTPVLHGGNVYVRGASGFEADVVLDAGTGEPVGVFDADFAPAFNDESIASIADGVLTLADAASGVERWSTSNSDYVTAPIVTNDYVIAGRADGSVDAFDLTGALDWSERAPAGIDPPEEHNNERMLSGLAAADGALLVPAGSTITAFFSVDNPTVAIRTGPAKQHAMGPSTSFSFWSADPTAHYICTLNGESKPCTSPVRYRGLDNGSHYFTVRQAGTSVGLASRAFKVDAVGPVVRLRPFRPLLSRDPTAKARWSAIDATSKVAAYQLRVRKARLGDRPPAWSVRTPTTRKTAVLKLRTHSRLCASVRAKDTLGNWSAWSSNQCVRSIRN